MTLGQRLLGLGLVAGALAGLGLWIAKGAQSSGDGTASGNGPVGAARFESSAQCASCHRDVYDEWHGSHHQIAYLNPEVRALSEDFRNKDCQACHLPRPVSLTGYGQRVLPRQTHPDEGVSCLSCHLGKDGEILGRNAVPSAPCAPKASKELVSVDLCGSCHNQHNTTDQWRASHYVGLGQDCNHCHMPPVERKFSDGTAKKGRGHAYKGAHDVETLRAAATFSVQLDGNAVALQVQNTGAGHNFPTEERHRAVDVEVSFTDGAGQASAWQRLMRFRQPYRDEPGENTQLPAGQTWHGRIDIPAGTRLVKARLWYRLTPLIGDDDPRSTLLFERELALP